MTGSRTRYPLARWAIASSFAVGLGLSPALTAPAWAQETGTIRGAVVEEVTWALIGSAKVTLVGTDVETESADDGTFLIAGVPLGRVLVRVQAEGFPAVVEEVEVTAGDVPLAVFIQSAVAALEGILVFGTPTNPRPTRAAKTAADLVADKVPSIRPILARATDSRNAPTTFTLRGRNSLSSSGEPLIIVDGIRMTGGVGYAVRVLNQLSAADVESIQVLKGASAGFVYGAPDGVIIIETKSRTPER